MKVLLSVVLCATCFSFSSVALAQEEEKLKTEVKLDLYGDNQHHARQVLHTKWYGNNAEPTGVSAIAGEEITVEVELTQEGQPIPNIMFTQQKGDWNNWYEIKVLSKGINKITVPRKGWNNSAIKGGAIYILYPYTKEQAKGSQPKVTITGGHKYPVFEDGEDVEVFRQELRDYKKLVKENPNKYIDVVDLYSDYVLLNSNLESAEAFLREKDQKDPQKVMDIHEEKLKALLAFGGIEDEGAKDTDKRNHARTNIRLMTMFDGAYAYAYDSHLGFQQGDMNSFFNGADYGWAIPHEIAHQLDNQYGMISETTNNMWANYNQVVLNKGEDRIPDFHYDAIFQKAGAEKYAEMNYDVLNGIAVWWQLYLYDENYWAKFSKVSRERKLSGIPWLDNNNRMVLSSSIALGYDMTEYFLRHKFINKNSADKISKIIDEHFQLEKLPSHIKPWYMWTKAVEHRGKTFKGEVAKPIIDGFKVKSNKIQLTISKIDDANKDALLGYEVYQDGVLLGFTNDNTFTTLADNDNLEHTYKVRAVDMKFNYSQFSDEVKHKGEQPSIDVTKSTIIPFGHIVDKQVRSYIDIHDADGTLMDKNQIKTRINEFGEGLGFYTVDFNATGKNGDATLESVRYHVVTDIIDPNRLDKTDYGRRVVYYTNKQYDLFESFFAIEGEGTATFTIYVDDTKKVFEKTLNTGDRDGYVKLEIPKNKNVELIISGTANGIWKDAKFANIHPKYAEQKVINSVKENVRNILRSSDLNSVTAVTYDTVTKGVYETQQEEVIYNKIKNAVDKMKVDGKLAISINNYNKLDNAADIINGGYVGISYTPKGSSITYYTDGVTIRKIDKSKK